MAKLFQVQFDAATDEIETAYKAFQARFALRKKLIYSVVYIIVIVLGVDLIIKNPTGLPGYIATGLAAGILLFNWIKPVMIRKKLMQTLSEMGDEVYTASFYDDRIEIETVIREDAETETIAITPSGVYTVEEGSEAEKEMKAKAPEKTEEISKTVYRLSETDIQLEEKNDLFMMFVNRSYIHTIPLRCLSAEEAAKVRKYFEDKALSV